ncbi:MAG TPA: serine/threonine-protein kinase [Polyangiaceae bacterium]|nr:serine/threonine-protein kinase [Polyangiaceae bacterium]
MTTLVRVPQLDTAWTTPDGALAATVGVDSAKAQPPPSSVPGNEFSSRYAMQTPLGEGGMGVVRLASDRRVGREVAMKTMREGRGSPGLATRFFREACVQAQLEHPAIVPVYDLGWDPSGSLYFTMKRVRGVNFAEIIVRLRSGDRDAPREYTRRKLLTAFASVCQAVDFAHSRGVVHRDLKPSNIMLGDFGEVYVLDWGVAKLVDTPDAGGDRPSIAAETVGAHTLEGAALGTPGYMAPEQARGDARIDGRTDVYALGAILFELLCLEPLHTRPTLASTLRGVDARPSARAPTRDIAPELDDICVRATALEPADRFANARELLAALERFLDGDRDLERRRQLAQEHAAAAASASRVALGSGASRTEARSRALREVGRALALDPTNAEAMSTLVALLTEPPREAPEEVIAEMHASSRETLRGTARGALLGYLAWFLFVPFGFWMGVRNVTASAIASGLWALAAVSTYAALRRPDPRGQLHLLGLITTTAAACVTCMVCGPYVLVPTLAVINVILWLLVSPRSLRPTIIGLGCLTVLLPAALDWTHLVRFYNFRDGRVTILQGMLDFPPAGTHALLFAASLALVGVAAVLITRFRDNLTEAEHRLHVQAWQLRQLVPPPHDPHRPT